MIATFENTAQSIDLWNKRDIKLQINKFLIANLFFVLKKMNDILIQPQYYS